MKTPCPVALAKTAWRLLLVILMLAVAAPAALAVSLPPDDYIGDAAIYTGVPSERPKPNILLVIDTSQATLNPAPGDAYESGQVYTGSYISERIYYSDQQGNFSANRSVGGNNPITVSQVSCVVQDAAGATVLDVGGTLAEFGSYSGSGSEISPNLSTTGECTTAPSGVVYATGNYLNYVNTQNTLLASSCDGRVIVIKHGTWPSGLPRKFKLIGNIIGSSVASQEPPVSATDPGGADWQQYWSLLPESDPTTITHQIIASGRGSNITYSLGPYTGTGLDGWRVGIASLDSRATFTCTVDGVAKTQAKAIGYYSWDLYYAMAATVPNTQRQAFYEALVPVIQAASSAVNFGFMTYNRLNQGASLGQDILSDAQSKDPVQVMGLINKLPSMANCTRNANNPSLWDCPEVTVSGPNRPQSEALYDAGYYLMKNPSSGGVDPKYKETDGTVLPDSQQRVNITTKVPYPNACGYNHIIFLTNGLPNKDTNTPNIGDWDGDGREKLNDLSSIQYGLGTHLLDDVAAYLKNEIDLRANPDNTKGGGITTHVILAFQAEDALLRNTASAGGGEFYNAYNTQGLSNALLNILANIVREADTSFVAPVVPASSTNRTRSGERVYLGLFKPQTNATWHGNLKKYQLSSTNDLLDMHGNPATNKAGDFIYSQSYWGTGATSVTDPTLVLKGADGNRTLVPNSYVPNLDASGNPTNADPTGGDGGIVNVGGAGGTLLARDLSTRRIFTTINGTKVTLRTPLSGGAVSYGVTPEQLGLPAGDTLKRSQLIDFVYGFDAYGTTYSSEGQALDPRKWVLGDILHSKPLVRSYWPFQLQNEAVCYSGTNVSGDVDAPYNLTKIYVGTNDGMLHAFNDCDGSEEWAFVPPLLLDKLQNLPDGGHEFYVDSSVVSYVYDADGDGRIETPDQNGKNDKIFLVFGLRRGGGIAYLTPTDPRGAYYMLDVTNPSNPQYLGAIDQSVGGGAFSELGETWSQPVIDWVQDGTTAKLAMFIGAGYDNNEDLRWGNTQTFPDGTTFTNDGDFTNDTDTTKPTNDGEDNGGLGVTSLGGSSQYNPKGRGIYIVELARISGTSTLDSGHAGEVIKGFTAANTPGMTFSFPGDLTVLDWEGSDFADRIYVGDTGGQLWRVDLTDKYVDTTTGTVVDPPGNDSSKWTARVIFKSNPGSDGTTGRKFFYRPDVGKDGTDATLFIGSGDREHPLNKAVVDRLYMIRDKGQTTAATESDLKDLTSNELQMSSDPATVSAILNELKSPSNYGWYVKLENPGEKMLAEPVLFFGDVLYTTYAPLPPAQDSCEVGNLGYARLYHLNSMNATAVANYDTSNDSTYDSLAETSLARGKEGEVLLKSDRVVTLGEGIPSGIVPLIDASGKVSLKIAASGRLTDIKGAKINTYYPLYWTETILK